MQMEFVRKRPLPKNAASFAGIPEMIMEARETDSLSGKELLDLVRRENINLRKYEQ